MTPHIKGPILESSDYYSFMSLPRTASGTEIRTAYRRLAMRFHPDMDGSVEASIRFGYLCEAYRCLSDAAARELYDRDLIDRRHPAISVEVVPDEDVAGVTDEDAADQVPPNARRQPRPGVTRFVLLHTPRRVPQNRINVRFQRRDPCPRCAGLGVRKDDNPPEDWSVCHACWGIGHVFAYRRLTIAYRSRRVLGGELIVPYEGDAGDHGGPRGNLMLKIVTPDHTTRGLMLPAIVGAMMIWFLLFCIMGLLAGCGNVLQG
jgi:hypothetical protein